MKSAAGLKPHRGPVKLTEDQLFQDWAEVVGRLGEIPTIHQYRRMGRYSPETFMRHFGPWVQMPGRFRAHAEGGPQWANIFARMLPAISIPTACTAYKCVPQKQFPSAPCRNGTGKLGRSPDVRKPHYRFRGLRHEPVNENGVVFLFGMVALELGYSVEAVQAGFPDCEAKRHIAAGKWQRVRIEFEIESSNFRDHAHAVEHCDVIVCWPITGMSVHLKS